jgi:uncharacterized protein YxeA
MKKSIISIIFSLILLVLISGFTINNGKIYDRSTTVYWDVIPKATYTINIDNKSIIITSLNSKTNGISVSYTAQWDNPNILHYINVKAEAPTFTAYSYSNLTVTSYSDNIQGVSIMDSPYGYGTTVSNPLYTASTTDSSNTINAHILNSSNVVIDSFTNTSVAINNSISSPANVALVQPTDGYITIDSAHEKNHDGKFFMTANTDTDLDTAEVCKLWLVGTGNSEFHGTLDIVAASAAYFYIYESPTVTNIGTASGWVCSNRTISAVSKETISYNPITTGAGTLILDKCYIPASSGGSIKIGATATGRGEVILKANTGYLFRIETKADNNEVTIKAEGYEN